jgi:molybdate transport system ATP-binding protein
MGLDAQIEVRLGGFHLSVGLTVGAGEVVALLGPNGAGKTTALRALSGLAALDEGRIVLDGTVLDDPSTGTWLPPERRPVSVVFQDHLLFPHLDAAANVAFGLGAAGVPRRQARAEAAAWLDRFGLADRATARPASLSGGEAQRVALARALAVRPSLLLLDEPLASLDAGTRTAVRRDLRRHLAAAGRATLLVTHDPLDALALASRVVVVEGGRVTQEGPIAELTERPRSRYVADLVGLNLLSGTASGTTVALDGGGSVTVAEAETGPVLAVVHPRAVALHRSRPDGSPRNRWPGRVAGFDLLGDRVRVRVGGPVPLVAEVTPAAVAALGLQEGDEVWTVVKATEIVTYSR